MKITDEKEVIGRIIKLINELHPVKTPRIDLQTPSFKRPSTEYSKWRWKEIIGR